MPKVELCLRYRALLTIVSWMHYAQIDRHGRSRPTVDYLSRLTKFIFYFAGDPPATEWSCSAAPQQRNAVVSRSLHQ
jgi:hypothetical protein